MIADLVQGLAPQSKNNNSTTPSGVVVRFRIKLDGQCPSRRTYNSPSILHLWAEIKNPLPQMIAELVQGLAPQSKNNNSTTPSGVVVRFRIKLDGQCPSRRTYNSPRILRLWAEIKNPLP